MRGGALPVGLFVVAMLALSAALVAAGKGWAAWPSWFVAAAVSVLFGLSHGYLVYPCALALLGLALDRWPARRRPRAPPAA